MSMHRSAFVCLGFVITTSACSDGGQHAAASSASAAHPGLPDGAVVDLSGATTVASSPALAGGPAGSGAPVLEPTTLLLFGTGLMLVARLRRREPQAA